MDKNCTLLQKSHDDGEADEFLDERDQRLRKRLDIKRHYGPAFDPFQGLSVIMSADRIKSHQGPLVSTTTSAGFQSCDRFAIEASLTKNSASICACIEHVEMEDMDISDSDILVACEQAEKQLLKLKSPVTTSNRTPNKSIVEAICQDFCSSPISPQQTRYSRNTTPMRTYNRKRRLSKQIELSSLRQGRGCSSNLSLQDEFTLVEDIVNTGNLNQSFNLCKNLLNLSEFFVDLPLEADIKPASITQPPIRNNISNMNAEQKGKLSQERGLISKILESEKHFTVPKRRRCLPPESFFGFSDDRERRNDNFRENNAKWIDEDEFCMTTIKIEDKVKCPALPINKNTNLEDFPLDLHSLNRKLKGFQTASGKNIHISKDASERAGKIFQALEEVDKNSNVELMHCYIKRSNAVCISPKKSTEFQTSSIEIIQISDNDKEHASQKLPNKSHFEQNTNCVHSDVELGETFAPQKDNLKLRCETLQEYGCFIKNLQTAAVCSKNLSLIKGFQTASGKNIKISEDSLKHVENIFQNFNDFEDNLNLKRMDEDIVTAPSIKLIPNQFVKNKSPTYSDKSCDTTSASLCDNTFAKVTVIDLPNSQPESTEPVILRKNLLTLNKRKRLHKQHNSNLITDKLAFSPNKTPSKLYPTQIMHSTPNFKTVNDFKTELKNTSYSAKTTTNLATCQQQENFRIIPCSETTPQNYKPLIKSGTNKLPLKVTNAETTTPICSRRSNSCRVSGLRRKRISK